ncbi:MAG: LPS export ABC transporter periplasmic protein LptC [Candidatus Adiutrix sp.]|jgi:LPS export ABC transporter protein LptC|nr:LPS export ABC transporter periplasmic protein LptC [Candidatus Adiutrix sp.]
MQRARFWILCALGALLAISGILLFGTRYWEAGARSLKNMLPANVDMRLDRLTLNEISEEGRSMVINADSAQYFKTQDLFVLDRVRAKVFEAPGHYGIEADTGRYEPGRRVITLDGRVRVADSDGGILSSDNLVLNFEESVLISEKDFCYAAPTYDFSGTSFVFHTRDRVLKAEGRIYFLFQ